MPVQPAFNATRVRVFYDGANHAANQKSLTTAVGYASDASHHNHAPVPGTPTTNASQAWTVKSATEATRIAGVLRNLGFTDIRITPAE